MTKSSQPRMSKGQPDGGQFGAIQRTESDIELRNNQISLDANTVRLYFIREADGVHRAYDERAARERFGLTADSTADDLEAVVKVFSAANNDDVFASDETVFMTPSWKYTDMDLSDHTDQIHDVTAWTTEDDDDYITIQGHYAVGADVTESGRNAIAAIITRYYGGAGDDVKLTNGQLTIAARTKVHKESLAPRLISDNLLAEKDRHLVDEYLKSIREKGVVVTDSALDRASQVNSAAVVAATRAGYTPDDADIVAIAKSLVDTHSDTSYEVQGIANGYVFDLVKTQKVFGENPLMSSSKRNPSVGIIAEWVGKQAIAGHEGVNKRIAEKAKQLESQSF